MLLNQLKFSKDKLKIFKPLSKLLKMKTMTVPSFKSLPLLIQLKNKKKLPFLMMLLKRPKKPKKPLLKVKVKMLLKKLKPLLKLPKKKLKKIWKMPKLKVCPNPKLKLMKKKTKIKEPAPKTTLLRKNL